MKLKAELAPLISKMETLNREQVIAHAERVKMSGNYKDFNTRISWDILHACYSSGKICEWYTKYNCNDTHITTLAVNAAKTVFSEIFN